MVIRMVGRSSYSWAQDTVERLCKAVSGGRTGSMAPLLLTSKKIEGQVKKASRRAGEKVSRQA